MRQGFIEAPLQATAVLVAPHGCRVRYEIGTERKKSFVPLQTRQPVIRPGRKREAR